jgi:transmembrane sensor
MSAELDRVQAEAAAWVVRLQSDQQTGADREAFNRWIAESEAHAEAYADLATFWESFGLLHGEAAAEVRAARAQPGLRSGAAARRWGGAAALLAASIAGVVALIGVLAQDRAYVTPRGGDREIALEDGSSVALDTDTRVRVRYSKAERRLILDRGQAYIRVAKNPSRPFRVFVGDDEVRAVGTAFEVRRVGDSARVVLVEGKVLVYRGPHEPSASRAAAVALAAGQQLDLEPGAASPPRPANLDQTLAWRTDRLVFDDERLSVVVDELNRYEGPKVSLADPAAGSLRVSGVFHAGRTQDTVAALAAAFPIRIERQSSAEIILGLAAPHGR